MGNLKILKTALVAVSFAAIAGCGDDSDSGGGGESAARCVDQQDVNSSTVNVTNTCDRTIIILVSDGRRFVIAPNDVNTINMVSGFGTNIAACFSPEEPEFDGSLFFTCG